MWAAKSANSGASCNCWVRRCTSHAWRSSQLLYFSESILLTWRFPRARTVGRLVAFPSLRQASARRLKGIAASPTGRGKLAVVHAGIATSLKVLFTSESCDGAAHGHPQLELERNEVIALLNLLERLSKSIEIVRTMSAQLTNSSPPSHGAVEEITKHPLQQFI